MSLSYFKEISFLKLYSWELAIKITRQDCGVAWQPWISKIRDEAPFPRLKGSFRLFEVYSVAYKLGLSSRRFIDRGVANNQRKCWVLVFFYKSISKLTPTRPVCIENGQSKKKEQFLSVLTSGFAPSPFYSKGSGLDAINCWVALP